MDTTNTGRNWAVGIVIALIIIVGVVYAIRHARSGSPVVGAYSPALSSTSTTITDTKTVTGAAGDITVTTANDGEMLSVANQKAGAEVTVDSMKLTRASWVAIKDSNSWILGAAWFPAGTTSGTVSLLRNTVVGGVYSAVIYVDDGDKIFDFHKDMLVTGADGTPGSATFTAQ